MIAPLQDGLQALRNELSLKEIAVLIERTAKWVSPDTFRKLPVWYPEYSRNALFYKANWSEPQYNINRATKNRVHKQEGNLYANKALTHALGLRSKQRPNWSCCHIWGIDDAKYASTNLIVQDPRFYSCVANMVLLPTPLKAFTDVMPEIKHMLRACAFYTYGWACDHEAISPTDFQKITANAAYPRSWPRSANDAPHKGIVPINAQIEQDIARRKGRIRSDLEQAGEFYPERQVREVLEHWAIDI